MRGVGTNHYVIGQMENVLALSSELKARIADLEAIVLNVRAFSTPHESRRPIALALPSPTDINIARAHRRTNRSDK